jgi:hypothetical protein
MALQTPQITTDVEDLVNDLSRHLNDETRRPQHCCSDVRRRTGHDDDSLQSVTGTSATSLRPAVDVPDKETPVIHHHSKLPPTTSCIEYKFEFHLRESGQKDFDVNHHPSDETYLVSNASSDASLVSDRCCYEDDDDDDNFLLNGSSSPLLSDDVVTTSDTTPFVRRVSFTSVQVREYDMTIGDSRSPMAYPLCLDWTYSDVERIHTIDEHHAMKLKRIESRRRCRGSTITPNDDTTPIVPKCQHIDDSRVLAAATTIVIETNNNNSKALVNFSSPEFFRYPDAARRLERLCDGSGIDTTILKLMERSRISLYVKNRRRATVGLPPLDNNS